MYFAINISELWARAQNKLRVGLYTHFTNVPFCIGFTVKIVWTAVIHVLLYFSRIWEKFIKTRYSEIIHKYIFTGNKCIIDISTLFGKQIKRVVKKFLLKSNFCLIVKMIDDFYFKGITIDNVVNS